MKCPKCEGGGKFKNYGDCFSCRGTGEMAFAENGVITFLGKQYKIGDELPFTNTRSKVKMGKVLSWWRSDVNGFEEKRNVIGWLNINDIWYSLLVIETGKNENYCLWRSVLKLKPQE